MTAKDINIFPFQSTDLARLNEVQPPEWPDITPYFEFYLSNSYSFPFRVTSEEELIGTGSVIFHRNTAWVAHIIVKPDYRGRGLGREITDHLLSIAKKRKPRSIMLIATPMGEPLYTKMGFIKDAEYSFFREGHTPVPSDSLIRNAVFSDFGTLLEMDTQISGEDRSILLTPHLPDAFVYGSEHHASGAYFPTLTEGLIIAVNKEAGLELMKYKYNKGIITAILPSDNIAGMNLLQESGSHFFRTASRMHIGEKINWKPEGIFSRIGGYLG